MSFETPLDVQALRAEFPVLSREVRPGVPLIYLDNAATTQKPLSVIEAMNDYYRRYNANVHRGIHTLSEEASTAYEDSRDRVAAFINAPREQVVFTRHATEAINIVVWGLMDRLGPGDVILTTVIEHHANVVPWQMLAQRTGAEMRYVPLTEGPEKVLDLEAFYAMLDESVAVVAFNHVSNVLGSVQPVAEIVAAAHAVGALAVVDGAQGVPHMPVDVQALDADFYAFSSHKMCGPTGIGVLYGKRHLLDEMPPLMGGGDMIKKVTLEGTTYNDLPFKFEPGTPAIAEAIGLGAAVDFLERVGMENIHAHETAITAYAMERLAEVPFVEVIGPQGERAGLAAMIVDGVHPHDLAQILDGHGVAIRAGKHCAHPLHQALGVGATARASFYLYNTAEEVDALIEGLYAAKKVFTF